jgi:hypothetical protein
VITRGGRERVLRERCCVAQSPPYARARQKKTHLGLVSNSMRQAPPLPRLVAVFDMPCWLGVRAGA